MGRWLLSMWTQGTVVPRLTFFVVGMYDGEKRISDWGGFCPFSFAYLERIELTLSNSGRILIKGPRTKRRIVKVWPKSTEDTPSVRSTPVGKLTRVRSVCNTWGFLMVKTRHVSFETSVKTWSRCSDLVFLVEWIIMKKCLYKYLHKHNRNNVLIKSFNIKIFLRKMFWIMYLRRMF